MQWLFVHWVRHFFSSNITPFFPLQCVVQHLAALLVGHLATLLIGGAGVGHPVIRMNVVGVGPTPLTIIGADLILPTTIADANTIPDLAPLIVGLL